MGGSAPRSEPVQIQPPIEAPGYDFSKAFFEQVAPSLLSSPYPSYGGQVDPGLSPTMGALLRGGQTMAASPFSREFDQAGSTLGGFMNVDYENPMASVDPNRYGFDYTPQDFQSLGQSAPPGMPRSMTAAAQSMGSPMGNVTGSLIGDGGNPDRGPGEDDPGNNNPNPPPPPDPTNNFPGLIPNPRDTTIDLDFNGFPAYRPISGGQGFVDYNPGSPIINMVRGMMAGSSHGNPMPPGPIGSPPGTPTGGSPPPGGPPGGGAPPPNYDPGGVVPGNQLTWFGQHHGVNKGKSMDEIHRDMYERGWDYGPNFVKPEGWGERGSKATTWAEVMRMPEHRRAPGSPGTGSPVSGGPTNVSGASQSGAPAGGK